MITSARVFHTTLSIATATTTTNLLSLLPRLLQLLASTSTSSAIMISAIALTAAINVHLFCYYQSLPLLLHSCCCRHLADARISGSATNADIRFRPSQQAAP